MTDLCDWCGDLIEERRKNVIPGDQDTYLVCCDCSGEWIEKE